MNEEEVENAYRNSRIMVASDGKIKNGEELELFPVWLAKKNKGELIYDGKIYKAKDRLKNCYMVMQDVNHQLFTESVIDEILLSLDGDIDNREDGSIENSYKS